MVNEIRLTMVIVRTISGERKQKHLYLEYKDMGFCTMASKFRLRSDEVLKATI